MKRTLQISDNNSAHPYTIHLSSKGIDLPIEANTVDDALTGVSKLVENSK